MVLNMIFGRNGILFFVIICLVFSISDSNARIYRRKKCHFNEFMRCWEPIRYFSARVNGTGMLNDNEFDWWCGQNLIFYKQCGHKWLKRCGNAMHLQLYEDLIVKPMVESIEDFCDPNKSFRKTFMKQTHCLQNKVKQTPEYRLTCVKDLQAGNEWIQQTVKYNFSQQIESICCVYNRWEKCIIDLRIEKCGPEQEEAMRLFIGSITGFYVSQICDRFHPESKLCLKYFQPKDLIPKGLRSNSFLSWKFSYNCPNIGYGVRPEQDV